MPVAGAALEAASPSWPVLPPTVEAAVWRAKDVGRASAAAVATGWNALDAQLPGGGWPRRAVTELLATQPAVLEWRLLSPALRRVVAAGEQVVVVGPVRHPHLPGLLHEGFDERQLVWIRADAPSERMWVMPSRWRSRRAFACLAAGVRCVIVSSSNRRNLASDR